MAIVKKDAWRRFETIDDEMGWEKGAAYGKLGRLWHISQENDEGVTVARRSQILDWAQVRESDAERFLELCCRTGDPKTGDYIHFLEVRPNGRYFIVGNPEKIADLKKHREQAINRGKASAESRRNKTGSAVPPGAVNHPQRAQSETAFEKPFEKEVETEIETAFEKPFETALQSNAETNAEKPPKALALALASALASASAEGENARAHAYDPDPDAAGPPSEQSEGISDPAPDDDLEPTGWERETAAQMRKAVQGVNPDAVKVRSADLAGWARTLREMRIRDGCSREAISHALFFIFKGPDPFWRGQITSPAKLRAKWDSISAQMNNPNDKFARRFL